MENYVGKRIDGRYEIHEIIGVGGMAVVYKAYDRIDDRIVAVKVLKDEFLANEEFRRRFKNESKYIAVLSHPNIVKVYDVHFGDTLQYIVMEYIEGITLKEYIEQQHTVSTKEAVYFITQILRALQHAHDKGIVHRDVKPQNIILLQNGTIKVTDFGIASFSRGDTFTLGDGKIAIGSVHYISPEQAKGNFTDARADIYSTGIVLYEMLTGQLPFVADTAVSIALMQIQQEPRRPREINSNIPIGLEQITLHAMEKDLKCRYQSAAGMLLDIDEYKRNNSVKFDYSYYVDNEPTKYIEKTRRTPVPVVEEIDGDKIALKQQNDPPEEEDDEENEVDRKNQRMISVLKGILLGLIVVAVVVGLCLFFFTDIFSGGKFEVPNFLSMNYEDEIKDNIRYKDIRFEIDYEYSSKYDYGDVIKQTPEKGKIISRRDSVYLTVNTSKTVVVNDVYGMQYLNAKKALESAGFKTNYEMVYDLSVEDGLVINTSPERGSEAPEASTITIFVATHIDKEAVITPDVLGKTREEAIEAIESVDLSVGEIQTEDSAQPKGTVVRQEPIGGDPLHEGESVNLYLSSGIAPKATIEISVPLPVSSAPGVLKVYVNEVAQSTQEVLLQGQEIKLNVTGSGTDASLVIEVDNKRIYSATVDFTTNPAGLSDVKNIEDYSSLFYDAGRAVLPSVLGLTEDEAVATLHESGFENVRIGYQTVFDSSRAGLVVSQSPTPSDVEKYSVDSQIVITIGKAFLG